MKRFTLRRIHRNLPKQRARPPVRCAPRTPHDRPALGSICGLCPRCQAPVVSNLYLDQGVVWECWQSLMPQPTCDYRKVLSQGDQEDRRIG